MRITAHFACWMEPEEVMEYCEILHIKLNEIPTERIFKAFDVFEDTPEYAHLMEALARHNQNPHILRDEVFSEEELSSAPIMNMVPNAHYGGYPQPERGYLEAAYDEIAGCPYCSMNWMQDKPLRLKSSVKMGKRSDISGVWWLYEFIVTRRAREVIEDHHLTGCEFWPLIKHGKDVPFEDIFQLKITGGLPPMATETVIKFDPMEGIRRRCKNGHGWTKIEGRVHYRASDLVDVPDFAYTREWLGGNGALWRWPYMSQKAYQVFKENKINGIRYYPPVIVDE